MEAAEDWDLLAVVRSCCNTTTTATTTSTIPSPSLPQQQQQPQQQQHSILSPLPPPQDTCFSPTTPTSSSSNNNNILFRFPNPFETATTSFQDLQDICKPTTTTNTATTISSRNNCSSVIINNSHSNFHSFVSHSLSSPVSTSSSSVIAGRSFTVTEQPQLRQLIKPTQVIFGAHHPSSSNTATPSQSQRTKKRKNLMKKVCHVPAEGLANDMWAWRKYGQKPIKGSPYPRGYYRCSSSKGCMARKQVERNRSDPKMFIVTYTAEHNHPMPTHRNSLAGSTRNKSGSTTNSGDASSTGAGETPTDQPTCSSNSGASLSPLTEKSESKTEGEEMMKDEEDNDMVLSDMMLNDDFYVGFEQIDGGDEDDCFSDQFSPTLEFPWLANSSSSSTAAAAGGS